ncbi:hypothetical protein [Actinoalloteichus sp. AHMU CJ021]|uniref:hypothetical protein n=1 Tax=Actinoalloteichus sp. AHMU CJ021 TaxID=2072503 RepID=UPI00268D10CB
MSRERLRDIDDRLTTPRHARTALADLLAATEDASEDASDERPVAPPRGIGPG